MNTIYQITEKLLLEQTDRISSLRKAITEKLPISIYYSGPPKEVRAGQRIDILPVVMGPHISSGNLVIWAFTFKGISKKGLPGWKMFRIDRIKSLKFNPKLNSFDLDKLPGYIKDKAPNAMRSLASVDVYSPYFKPEDQPQPEVQPEPQPQIEPQVQPEPEVQPEPQIQPDDGPIEKPDLSVSDNDPEFRTINSKVIDNNGLKSITQQDYMNTISNLRKRKEDEWKVYQRMLSGNMRPGQGTRKRFDDTSKSDVDRYLSKNHIKINDPSTEENLMEVCNRFKALII